MMHSAVLCPPGDELQSFVSEQIDRTLAERSSSRVSWLCSISDVFSCPCCQDSLLEPKVLPCGHTFCHLCINGARRNQVCPLCFTYPLSSVRQYQKNIVICSLIDKVLGPTRPADQTLFEARRMKTPEQTRKVLDEAILKNPTIASLYLERGQSYLASGYYTEAAADAEEAIAIRPASYQAHFLKGRVLMATGDFLNAILSLLISTYLSPGNKMVKDLQTECQRKIQLDQSLHSAARNNPAGLISEISSRVCTQLPMLLGERKGPLWGLPEEKRALIREDLDCMVCCRVFGVVEAQYQASYYHWVCTPGIKTLHVVTCRNACFFLIRWNDLVERKDRKRDPNTTALPCLYWRKELLHVPISTPCGHTFCMPCMQRSLDHQWLCPVCRSEITTYLPLNNKETHLISTIIKSFYPSEWEARLEQHAEETKDMPTITFMYGDEIPVFVCLLALPFISYQLHVFEPRYRLMMRRCLSLTSPQFGMCLYEHSAGFSDYGVMLHINFMQVLPDGKSNVSTLGGRRFKVVSRGMKDGYNTARVQWIQDTPIPPEEKDQVLNMSRLIYNSAFSIWRGLAETCPGVRSLGPVPSYEEPGDQPDGPVWLWWFLYLLEREPSVQYSLLSSTSYKDRIQHLFNCIHTRRH